MEITAIVFTCVAVIGFIVWSIGIFTKKPKLQFSGAFLAAIYMCGALLSSAFIAFEAKQIIVGILCIFQVVISTFFWLFQAIMAYAKGEEENE